MTRRKAILWLLVGLACLVLFPWLWKSALGRYYAPVIYSTIDVPRGQVAIAPKGHDIFGAEVYQNGRLSGVLRDRMDTAIALYERGAGLRQNCFSVAIVRAPITMSQAR